MAQRPIKPTDRGLWRWAIGVILLLGLVVAYFVAVVRPRMATTDATPAHAAVGGPDPGSPHYVTKHGIRQTAMPASRLAT